MKIIYNLRLFTNFIVYFQKISIPSAPKGRDFTYDPPPLWIFQIRLIKWTSLPSGNSIFVTHPLEILPFLVETKNQPFFSARYQILILTVFPPQKKFGGYCDQHITRRYVDYIKDAYRRICDMKIRDLIR